jgi:hypothetical protein
MLDLLDLQKHFILTHLKAGDTACDFTMGNGYDTEFLSKTVGDNGKLWAFDIQQQAVDSTSRRLKDTGCPENYTLICDSHHRAAEYVEGKIKAGMFNLGWMPGGDHTITTMRATTLPAIETAISLLEHDGIITVAIYPGHEEGDLEGKMVEEYLSTLSKYRYCVTKIKIINSPTSPYFFIIESK